MNITNFWTRVIATTSMLITIGTSYAIGRRIKDSIISIYVGVETINTIKMFVILPATIIIMFLYQRFTLNASDERKNKIFYYLNIPFILYFLFYGLVEYTDNRAIFEYMNLDISSYIQHVPSFMQSFLLQLISPMQHTMDVVFYTLIELYGTLILSFSFWKYVNSYTTKADANILYPYYASASCISMIIAACCGYMVNYIIQQPFLISLVNIYSVNYDSLYHAINIFIMFVCMTLSLIAYSYSLKEHINDYKDSEQEKQDKKQQKANLTIMSALKQITSNALVIAIGLSVICYMVVINLVEISWKKQVYAYYRLQQNDKTGMTNIYSTVQLLAGMLALINGIVVRLLLSYSWLITALITPVFVSLLGLVFLVSSMLLPTYYGHESLFITVLLGAGQNAFAKSSKYTFFDITKETAMLYLPKQIRDGSKGAVDMVCGRFGKSMGGIIQIILLSLFVNKDMLLINGQETITPYITFIVAILTTIWITITFIGSKEIKKIKALEQTQEKTQKK